MAEMRRLQGVVPVLVTPVTPEGEVDETALRRLVESLNEREIGGFWVLGTGGEDMDLTYDQRLTVARTVSRANGRKVPVVLGASFFALRDSERFMDETSDLAIDAYHIMPYHPLLSLDRIAWLYRHLADRASRPVWMYTSANWCRFIPPDFIAEMKSYPNIAGVKFSTSNIVHTEQVISLADDNFQVLTAVVRQFFSSLSLGVEAGTTVEACPFPGPIIDIYKKFSSGDLEGALKAQKKLNRLLERMPEGPGKDNFLKVAEGKYILSKKGICGETMTGYYRGLNDSERAEIDELLEQNPWAVE